MTKFTTGLTKMVIGAILLNRLEIWFIVVNLARKATTERRRSEMKMNRKNGITMIELLIVLGIIGLVTLIVITSVKETREERMKTDIPQGKLIAEPEAGVVYEKTMADPLTTAVVAIPRDKYYTEGTPTLNRVLVRVNNQAIVNAPVGALFMRDSKGQDHILGQIQPTQTNWVDYGTAVVPEVVPAK